MASLSCMNSVKRSGDKRPTPVRPPAVILFEYIGDRSGSTTTIYSAQMAGLQKCISDRREDAQNTGARCLVSITTFDDDVETLPTSSRRTAVITPISKTFPNRLAATK